jgi:hypothetical protein
VTPDHGFDEVISSAALHASCLSEYLVGDRAFGVPAAEFFALQEVVVDAAWIISAGRGHRPAGCDRGS